MRIWTHLVANIYLCTLIYDRDGEPQVDEWTLHNGPHGPELEDSPAIVSIDMTRMIEAEFERHGIEAFSIGALYRLQVEEDDHAA